MAKPKGKELFDGDWRRRSVVEPITERSEVGSMIRTHYIGKWPGVTVLTLKLSCDGIARGVIVFALPPRETSKRYGGETWELARLWIDDGVPSNAETFLIAKAVRYIKRNFKTVKYLVSYANPDAGHSGTIYKAANWKIDGRSDEGRKTPRCDYRDETGKIYSRKKHIPEGVQVVRVPRTSKFRFVYEL